MLFSQYFDYLYSNKLENLDKMDKFLDVYNQAKFKQMDINHLKISIASKKIEQVIVSKEKLRQMDSLPNSSRSASFK
jgi:hypothetical protein